MKDHAKNFPNAPRIMSVTLVWPRNLKITRSVHYRLRKIVLVNRDIVPYKTADSQGDTLKQLPRTKMAAKNVPILKHILHLYCF